MSAIIPYTPPPLPVRWQPQLNQVYCMDALTLLGSLDSGSVDLIMTSPPYDNLRTYNGFSWDYKPIGIEAYRVLKPGGVMVWVVGDATINGSETLSSMRQALHFVDVCGFKMHDTMIYHRDGRFPEVNRYWQTFEYMLVLSKGVPSIWNPIMRENKHAGSKIVSTQREKDGRLRHGSGYLTLMPTHSPEYNVWHIPAGNNKSTKDKIAWQHPAIFPEELARRHIYTWSNPGDTVLDFFMGSGTTAKMARMLNRNFIGCDLSPEYVRIARDRLQRTDPYRDTVHDNGMVQHSLWGDAS